MPKTVVIMAAKNAESTIALALRSALRELPRDSAIHVWNDASEDRTLAILETIRDARLRIHNSSTSVGSGVARASLVARTDSEYVANLDADDVWLPGHISVTRSGMRDSDFIFTSALKFGSRLVDARLTRIAPLTPPESSLALLIHNPFFHSSMLARRAALERAGSYADQRRGQDYDLWLRAAAGGSRIRRLPLATVAYRISETQISRSDGYLKRIAGHGDVATNYLALFDGLRRKWDDDQTDSLRFLRGIPARMSRLNRAYYAKVVRANPVPVYFRDNGETVWRGY